MRERGDISRGVASTGDIWRGDATIPLRDPTTEETDAPPRGLLGAIVIGKDGAGSAFLDKEVRIWEVIGRGLVVAPEGAETGAGDVVVGVIARSAGVWDNEKTVCSCSGKTVWEERGEQVARGML